VAVDTFGRLAGDARAEFVRIFEESFPPEEREDTGSLLASIAAGSLVGLRADEGGSLVGLAVVSGLPVPGVNYLEYLAVAPERRNLGVGGVLLRRLGPLGGTGTVFEVEAVAAAEGEERELRRRRVAFYERHGAVEVDAEYRAPRLDGPGELPFTLMWLPGREGPPRLEGDLLRAAVAAVLTHGYGLDGDDPLVVGVMAGLPA
jgi:GNAT superfamily N-acetyltransferase